MNTRAQSTRREDEPMGIVISRGTRDEATPKFVAYVWGPAPEPTPAAPEPKGGS